MYSVTCPLWPIKPISPKNGECIRPAFMSILASYSRRKSSPSIQDKSPSWATTRVVEHSISFIHKSTSVLPFTESKSPSAVNVVCRSRRSLFPSNESNISFDIKLEPVSTRSKYLYFKFCFYKPTTYRNTVQTRAGYWKFFFRYNTNCDTEERYVLSIQFYVKKLFLFFKIFVVFLWFIENGDFLNCSICVIK